MRGIVADSKAYCKRTLGLCLEEAGRGADHARAAHLCRAAGVRSVGPAAVPIASGLLLEKPGRTRQEPPRRWHGHRVVRQVEVADADGRLALADLRFLVVHSSQLAETWS